MNVNNSFWLLFLGLSGFKLWWSLWHKLVCFPPSQWQYADYPHPRIGLVILRVPVFSQMKCVMRCKVFPSIKTHSDYL